MPAASARVAATTAGDAGGANALKFPALAAVLLKLTR